MKNKKEKNIEKIFFHRFKEDNWNLVEKYNNESLKFLGLEIEIDVEISEDGNNIKIVAIEGIPIEKEIIL